MSPAQTPQWAGTPDDVLEYINEAHAEAVNLPDIEGTGDGVHVGIFDSACRLPKDIASRFDVNQGAQHRFISTDADDTNRHGTAVFRRASAFAPDAEFSLYQTVETDRRLPIEAYSDAITQAIADGVDIVNISSGAPWRHPVEANPNVQVTKRLLEAGIVVVAAAGNHFPGRQPERPPVHCPSAASGVVSVGAMVSRCPRRPGNESATTPEGPYFWIVADAGINSELSPSHGVFCGERGCVGGDDCAEHKTIEAWERNPLQTDDKPDVLAPMHTIRRRDTGTKPGWEYLATGTSFSAPLVTGGLAAVFSELRAHDHSLPDPFTVQSRLRETATPFEAEATPRFDATAFRDSFLQSSS